MNTAINSMNKFKTNHDLLRLQQQDLIKGGAVLKSIFSVSAKHPLLSLLFVLFFGILTNALFELIHYIVTAPELDTDTIKLSTLLVVLFAALLTWIFVRIRAMHPYVFKPTPLDQKRVLLTIMSKSRSDFKQTPAYNTYESLIYSPGGQSAPNALQKVILITSELPEVRTAALALKAHIETSGREAELFGITADGKSLLELQKQIEVLFVRLEGNYEPHEIIADYTGGTKEMSIALLKVSEKDMIDPIYLNEATAGNHSVYS